MKRLPFIDWARGFAVVAMVLWHTGDAWLRAGLKDGQGYFLLRFIGGLAAPSFLFLAGVGAALSARPARDAESARRARSAGVGRGLEIVVIGYALRLQSWLVDGQALSSLRYAPSYVPLAVGYTLAFAGARRMARPGPLPRATHVLALAFACAAASCALGFAQLPGLAPQRLTRLLQVDVLQCIGASLCLLALLEGALRLHRTPLRVLLLGLAVTAVCEPLSAALADARPLGLLSWFVRMAPVDGVQPALFPLFPWFAYACFGAAFGVALRHAPSPGALVSAAAPLAAGLGLCTSEAQPFVHRLLRANPWTVAPIRVGFRCAVVMSVILIGYVWAQDGRGRFVVRLGQRSMRIYWAHMLFAYGVLGRAVQHRLDYGSWAGLAAALLVLMWLWSCIEVPRGTADAAHPPPVRT